MEEKNKITKRMILVYVILILIILKIVTFFYESYQVNKAEYIIKIGYRGLENMFHKRYEYYAITKNSAFKISTTSNISKDILEKENLSLYNDSNDVNYWYVILEYSPDAINYYEHSENYLDTKFGPSYRLFYKTWIKASSQPDEDDLKVILKIAETLYNGDIGSYSNKTMDYTYLISYMIMEKNNDYFIEADIKELYDEVKSNKLYTIDTEGNLRYIMDVPDRGILDQCFFLK